MVHPEDITVVTPCLFPDPRPIWMLAHTCERFGIPLHPYGLGETYAGWVKIKIDMLREVAAACPTSHILYTDGRDAWFLAGLGEVADKYNALGAPPLMLSAQVDIFGSYAASYEGIPWRMDKLFRYTGTPGQLCEAKALAEALGWMQGRLVDWGQMPDDDPEWWNNFQRERPGDLAFDHDCSIFLNAGSGLAGGSVWDHCVIEDGRVHCLLTDSWPCIVHYNGGSSHWLKGKWDSLQKPWRALGYTVNPPWTEGETT